MPDYGEQESNPIEYRLIEKARDLPDIVKTLEQEPAIGVDLECDSMFHYTERVCLLQIATRAQNFVIDPLSVENLSPLAPLFADGGIEKVFHGADYDIRSLYRDFGIKVQSLFDTQIGARFLGFREIGLASLLKERFSVLADKKYQKKDWSTRPLPGAMIQYAVQDIQYLLPLADMLKAELAEKRLLFCAKEENELLSRVRPDVPKNTPLFLSFKGASRLDPRSLAVLDKLLSFRDQEARRRDCPHFKVLGNEPVMEMARIKPVTERELKRIKGLSPKLIHNMGRRLIETVKEGLSLPEAACPVYPRKPRHRLKPEEAARVKGLKRWRDQKGKALGVDPALVCTNAQIQAIAAAKPGTPEDMTAIREVRNWQIKRFGPDICMVLQKTG
ncbi:MAG: HRDC domain-containing protein [Thermodesulfobacteriota bacterium]